MSASGFAPAPKNTRDWKTAGTILRKRAEENFFGAADESSNRASNASLQTDLLDMLANTEAGYAAVIEGVEEFLYQEELQAGRS
jgi:hypothetical protein